MTMNMMSKGPIRVVLADDHHLVRRGIGALLEKAEDIEVVGQAASGQEALELVERLAPDVLVLDIAMPGLDGLQVVGRVEFLEVPTRVVILSMYAAEALVARALRAGVNGYLLKGSSPEELRLAIRAASRGQTYLSPKIAQIVVRGYLDAEHRGGASGPVERLTPREREVLQLVAEGHSSPAIADRLQLSTKTVEKHRSSLMAKLGVHNAAELIRVALKRRLVFIDEDVPPLGDRLP
jgi:DNA-binding NarL/FixJ family response regulator